MTIETNVNNFPDVEEEKQEEEEEGYLAILRQERLEDFFKYRGTVPFP